MRKIFSAILLLVVIAVIAFLTLQSTEQTKSLSHPVYTWFKEHGFSGTEHELRSLAHIPEYFALGIVLILFADAWGLGKWFALATGAICGLLDEIAKNFLPGREFDFGDWIKDLIGISAAIIVILLIQWIFRAARKRA